MPISIETNTHHTNGSQYMQAIAEIWFARWWRMIVLPIAICLALGILVNVAFIFVTFMIICMIVPLIMLFLYFSFALTTDAHMAILNKRMIITPGESIIVIFEPVDDEQRVPPPINVPWSAFTTIKYRHHDMVIHLKGSHYRIIVFPYDALNEGECHKLFSSIRSLNDK